MKKKMRAVKVAEPRRRERAVIPSELIAHSVGGHLALDFCNTAGEHLSEEPNELWRDRESFLRWAIQIVLVGTK